MKFVVAVLIFYLFNVHQGTHSQTIPDSCSELVVSAVSNLNDDIDLAIERISGLQDDVDSILVEIEIALETVVDPIDLELLRLAYESSQDSWRFTLLSINQFRSCVPTLSDNAVGIIPQPVSIDSNGVQRLVDGYRSTFSRELLQHDIEVIQRRIQSTQDAFTDVCDIPPDFPIITDLVALDDICDSVFGGIFVGLQVAKNIFDSVFSQVQIGLERDQIYNNNINFQYDNATNTNIALLFHEDRSDAFNRRRILLNGFRPQRQRYLQTDESCLDSDRYTPQVVSELFDTLSSSRVDNFVNIVNAFLTTIRRGEVSGEIQSALARFNDSISNLRTCFTPSYFNTLGITPAEVIEDGRGVMYVVDEYRDTAPLVYLRNTLNVVLDDFQIILQWVELGCDVLSVGVLQESCESSIELINLVSAGLDLATKELLSAIEYKELIDKEHQSLIKWQYQVAMYENVLLLHEVGGIDRIDDDDSDDADGSISDDRKSNKSSKGRRKGSKSSSKISAKSGKKGSTSDSNSVDETMGSTDDSDDGMAVIGDDSVDAVMGDGSNDEGDDAMDSVLLDGSDKSTSSKTGSKSGGKKVQHRTFRFLQRRKSRRRVKFG